MRFKKYLLLLSVLPTLAIAQIEYCQTDLFPKFDGSRWGYVDAFGNWKVRPYFEKAYTFHGARALVMLKTKYGAVNCNGELIIRCEYDRIMPFIAGRAWAVKNNKWGLINGKGEVLLPFQYDEIKEINNFARTSMIRKDSLWGVFDKFEMEIVWKPVFKEIKPVTHNLAFAKRKDKIHIIHLDIAEKFSELGYDYVRKLNRRFFLVNYDHFWSIINMKGVRTSVDSASSVADHSDYYLRVTKNNRQFLSDFNGNRVSKKFDSIHTESQAGSVVSYKGKYGFITKHGKMVIGPKYEELSAFNPLYAVATNENGSFVIDRKQKAVSDTFQVLIQNDNHFCGKKDSIWYMLDENGQVMEYKLQALSCEDKSNHVRVKAKNQWRLLHVRKDAKISLKYDSLHLLRRSYFVMHKGANKGLLDSLGEEIIPALYDSITPYYLKYAAFMAWKGGLATCYNRKGIKLVSEISSVQRGYDNQLIISKQGKSYLFKPLLGTHLSEPTKGIRMLGEGYYAVQNRKWEIRSKDWRVVSADETFDDIKPISNGFMAVKVKKEWGYWNPKFHKYGIKPQYATAGDFKNLRATVTTINGKSLLIDKRGNEVKN